MADKLLTLLDITKMNGTDQAVGIIEEVRTFAPEVEVFGGRPISGITYKGLRRSALPTGPAFRRPNEGSATVASKWDQTINQTFLMDAQMKIDTAVADASEFGADWVLGNEATGVAKQKMIALGWQFYYGDAGVTTQTNIQGGNTNYGYNGLNYLYDPAVMEVASGDTTATAIHSSAWLVVNQADCCEFIYGKNRGLELGQWVKQYVLDVNSNQYLAYLNNLQGYVGLSFNYTKSALRIKNLTATAQYGLTDKMVAQGLAKFPVGVRPSHLFCTRAQRLQLQLSRTPVYGSTGSAITAATALQFPPMPTESNGIPLYVTDSISDTENYSVAGTGWFLIEIFMATQIPNKRLVRDALLSVTKVLPAAGGNNTSPSFDLGTAPYHPEEIYIEIAFPACAANTSTGDTYTAQLYDSADNVTFLATSPIVEMVVPGVAFTGSLAIAHSIKLPSDIREYVAFKVTATSGTGDNTAQSMTYSMLL